MASPSTVITLGYGSFGSVNLVPTLGYGSGAVVVEADTPGGVFRRTGDVSRVFRRLADSALRVFRRHDPPNS